MIKKFDYNRYKKLKESFPFGNSVHQNMNFLSGGENSNTAIGSLRYYVLNLDTKLKALEENKYNLKEVEINLEEIDYKIKNKKDALGEEVDFFEIMRLEVKKEKIKDDIDRGKKLVRDAEIEAATYDSKIDSLLNDIGKIPSREDYENDQRKYWIVRLINKARVECLVSPCGLPLEGTIMAIEQNGIPGEHVKFSRHDITGILIPAPCLQMHLDNMKIDYDSARIRFIETSRINLDNDIQSKD